MAIGDVSAVDIAGASDLYCLDTGMYDTPEYGAVYLLDADRPALVDTGIGTHYERVLDAMTAVGIDPDDLAVIAPTHVHLDHAGGAGFLATACPNAEVVVHEIGAPHLVDPERLVAGTKRAVGDQWRYYVDPEPVPEGRVRAVADGDAIDLGDRRLDVHHAPGHAPHQAVYHDAADGVAFAADAAGIWVPTLETVRPTTPPPNFDLDGCLADVAMLQRLDPDVLCYGHFGATPAGEKLERYAAVLEEWVATVERARETIGDREAIVEHVLARDDIAAAWGAERARGDAELNVSGVLHYLDRRDG